MARLPCLSGTRRRLCGGDRVDSLLGVIDQVASGNFGIYAVDVLGKPHQYDDSYSRRELTWSPSVGSFEQEIPAMARWLTRLPVVAAVLAEQPASAGATSLRGR